MCIMEALLSCPVCMKPHFEGVDALRTSLISVATTHISCPVCNDLFLGLDKLTIHLFSHISNQKVMQDNQSRIDITKSDINIKNKSINENDNTFNNDNSVETINHEQDVEMPSIEEKDCYAEKSTGVVCEICNFHFSDETILDLHQKLLHQTAPDEKTGKYNYHCHLCSKQFKMRGSLMVHLRVAHFGFVQSNKRNRKLLTNLSGKETPKQIDQNMEDVSIVEQQSTSDENKIIVAPLQQAQPLFQVEKRKALNGFVASRSQDNKQWECEICLKLFTTKYFLKKHKRLHTGEMPYYCSQCNKYFTFQQSYHKHMLYHSDEKPHICTECGRAFKELSTLHNHERIHSGERPFSCETCGKCFRQRVSYLVHRRIHTGVMPYKCTACNKSFRYKVSQRSHKCPVNPPGCVVRTPDLVEKLIQSQNVSQACQNRNNNNEEGKYNTSNVENNIKSAVTQEDNFNFLQENFNVDIEKYLNENKASITVQDEHDNKQLKSSIINVSLLPDTCNASKQEDIQETINFSSDNAVSSNSNNTDFFTLILSPVLSDVQSLCLSNYCDAQTNNDKKQDDALETINEESFKELLYGPTTK